MNNPINLISNFEQTLLSNSGDDAFEVAFFLFSIKLIDEIEMLEGKKESEFIEYNDIDLTIEKIYKLENKVNKRWPILSLDKSSFNMSNDHMYRVIHSLHTFNLIETDLSVIDAILEKLVSSTSKSSLGQYFTPREVIKLCVEVINPQPNQTILDPACGSSGFLFESTIYAKLKNQISPICLGMDISSKSIRVAYLMKLAKSLDNIDLMQANSLDNSFINHNFLTLSNSVWAKNKDEQISLNNLQADIVFANPPYAGTIENNLLRQYELAKDKNSVSREILFIERCIKFLKANGKLAIVIPKGVLSNSSYKYVREWILSKTKILAVIGLDANAFMPYTSVQTSILILENTPSTMEDEILFTCSFNSGHDSSGRNISENDYKQLSETVRSILYQDLTSQNIKQSHPFKKLTVREIISKDRLDAEFYLSDVQDNIIKLKEISNVTINDVAIGSHKKFNKKSYSSIRYVDISSVEQKFGYVFPNKLEIESVPGRASYLLQKGDVLISTVRPERNTIALVNHELDEPMIASNGFCVLRPENVNPYYLYAYCKSDLFKNSLSGLATSSMYPTVSDKDILNMPIIYPDISTQKNIEEKVEASFRKIQEAQQDINQAIELINTFLNSEIA
jgi:type I restriction enzyme M protein